MTITLNKVNIARLIGWGQFVVTIANEVLQKNGGVLPSNKQGWMALGSSLLVAMSVHIAAGTSAGHPNGSSTIRADDDKKATT